MAVGNRRVIAGVSGSVRSLAALRAAVTEARISGAPLQAVLAWAPVGGELAYARAPCAALLEQWEQAACQRLLDAFDKAFGGMPRDVEISAAVVRAAPGPALVELAGRPDDLLVVGYGGRGWLGRATHGAVTRYCIAHARCPVLTVPPPDLIQQMRRWRHQWRPEDFIVPLAG